MKVFDVDYQMDGRTFGVRLLADNWEDAERRLKAVKYTGAVGGEIVAELRGNSVTLPFDWITMKIASFLFRSGWVKPKQ